VGVVVHCDDEEYGEIPQTGPRKRSVNVLGKSTSIVLRDQDWEELQQIARGQGISANELLGRIRQEREGNLGRAVRLHIVNHRTGAFRRDGE
jgi:predicted DNA-binding ribbon-helix-helix protein